MNEVVLETPTNFIEVLGNNPTSRILDFLIENTRECWALTEISENAKVSYPSVKLIIPKLLEKKIIKIGKTVGKIKFYCLAMDSPIAKKLRELQNTINKVEIEKYLN